MESSDDVEQRGFARAVGADQPGDTPAFNAKGGILNGADAAKVLIEILDF